MVEPSTSRASTRSDSPSTTVRQRKKKDAAEASASPSTSLIDIDDNEPSSRDTENITDEEPEKPRTCMDSMREFGRSCKVFFEEQANSLIDYFNEISADYRTIAVQLEKERRIKYREHAKLAQQKMHMKEEGEGSTIHVSPGKVMYIVAFLFV